MTSYTLRRDLDLPAIYANAACCAPACVDWLQEVVGIDLGNLLWAFAKAEEEAVEPMRDVLATWLECHGSMRAEVVANAGRRSGPFFGEPHIAKRSAGAPPDWQGIKRRCLVRFDCDVFLLVSEWTTEVELSIMRVQSNETDGFHTPSEHRCFLSSNMVDKPQRLELMGGVAIYPDVHNGAIRNQRITVPAPLAICDPGGPGFVVERLIAPSQFLPQRSATPEDYGRSHARHALHHSSIGTLRRMIADGPDIVRIVAHAAI